MKRQLHFYLLPAAAILIGGVAAERLSVPWRTAWKVEHLHDRPSEYWLGSPYVNERATRGANISPPAEVLEAAASVRQHLDAEPESPLWTRWQGRIDLLLANHDAAIQELESVRDIEQGRAGTLGDLGVAYARRGDIEDRVVDYGRAADVLEQAVLADPKQPRLHFNLALVYERLQILEEALRCYQRAAELATEEGWRSEASKRRKALEDRVQRRHSRTAELRLATASVEDLENLQDQALEQWAGPRGPIVERFARGMVEQHGDTWWEDAVRKPRAPEAEKLLVEAVRKDLAGEDVTALDRAEQAMRLFRQASNAPGELRAMAEAAYALQRARRYKECFATASELDERVRPLRYRWLAVHALLQKGTCGRGINRSAEGLALLREAVALAFGSRYRSLALRARGLLMEWQALSGDQTVLWRESRAGLEQYWATSVTPIRAHQFCFNLAKAAQQLDLPYAADAFLRCATNAAASTPMLSLELQTRLYHAASALTVGRYDDMQREFAAVQAKSAPANASGISRDYGELERSEAEVQLGQAAQALARLQSLEQNGETRSQTDAFRLRHHQVSGQALMKLRRSEAAAEKFDQAVALNEKRLATLPAVARVDAMRTAGAAYRGLVALQAQKDPDRAFQLWETFRAATLRGPHASGGRQFGHKTFLAFTVLADSIDIWLTDDRGFEHHSIALRQQQWQPVAKRFLRRCSTPNSSVALIREDGRRLYDWLIAPVAARLDPRRTLIIEPDDMLSGLPMQALVDPQGAYLGERFAVVISGGLAELERRRDLPRLSRDASVSVMADPKLSAETQRTFPPLPHAEREARFVASRFANSVMRRGEEATIEALRSDGAIRNIFHFAGHGFINGGNGGLLLSDGVLQGEQVSSGDWSACQLAVLSACSTGTGETRGPVNPQSLVRAFLLAGAGRVAASLWNVNSSSTSELMERFYEAIAQGVQPSSALQQASRAIRTTATTAHPYYWAAFQLYGAP